MSTDALRGTAASASPESRLEASRQALRAAMLPRPADHGAPLAAAGGSSLPGRVGTLLSHPVLAALREGVTRWWHKRPWRPVVVIGAEVASKAMVPLARRHPGRLIGGAMIAGALLSRLRPWKWIARSIAPALLASVASAVVARLAGRVSLPSLLQAAGLAPAPAPAAAGTPRQVAPVPAPVPVPDRAASPATMPAAATVPVPAVTAAAGAGSDGTRA